MNCLANPLNRNPQRHTLHCDRRKARLFASCVIFLLLLSVTGSPLSAQDTAVGTNPTHRPGFGIGPATGFIVSSEVDQIVFPGFNVMSVWHSNDWMVELRGRFFFGDIDVYHFEVAGYRPLADENPRLFAGGGLGYGGMNRKETVVHNINNQPVPGLFYHNGNGLHAFLGFAFTYPSFRFVTLRTDVDYFIALYHIDEMRMPSGLRIGLTMILHTP